MKKSKYMVLNCFTNKKGATQCKLTIPYVLCEALGWKNKDKIKVMLKDHTLVLKKIE